MSASKSQNLIERPPVVVIMGHIDHGKSTLLDYIRKSSIVAGEAGAITQHLGAYEVEHTDSAQNKKRITFIDTPGHEAFKGVRSRGAKVADIAILIVSAEDGVMPQTLEALKVIKENEIPFIVAINKIDTPKANAEQTKASLIENEIYVEGYGGTIPVAEISAKTGQNIDELLDLILLSAEIEEFKADPSVVADGFIVEVHKDKQKGISSTLVIKNGTLKQGQFVACEDAFSPVRIMEDHNGTQIQEASFSTPVHVRGWNQLPAVGLDFQTFDTKKEAEKYCLNCKEEKRNSETSSAQNFSSSESEEKFVFPLIIKADTQGSVEAIEYELGKIDAPNVEIKVVSTGTGNITEADVKTANSAENTIILGFGIDADKQAKIMGDRIGIELNTFKVIYDLVDWIKKEIETKRPRLTVEERTGLVKVLKIFNKVKNQQVIGGKVKEGSISVGNNFKVLRRGEEIGRGIIKGLQQQKTVAQEVTEGTEFGSSVDSRIELAAGDEIESFRVVEK